MIGTLRGQGDVARERCLTIDAIAARAEAARTRLADLVALRGIRTILLVSSRLHGFAGVQMIQADLSTTFAACGAVITTAVMQANPAFIAQMGCYGEVVEMDIDPHPLLGRGFDLVIAHNWPAWGTALLECQVRFRYLLLCSYSAFGNHEALWGIVDAADALVFHAEDGYRQQAASLAGCSAPRYVTRNPLPIEWFAVERPAREPALRRIAIVSNRATHELLNIRHPLAAHGIVCDVIGDRGTPERVTPGVIDRYDALVSIGHTVQKALSRGVPIFCYDHWGGPGWITPGNLEDAERENFSGRDCPRNSSTSALADEIQTGFAAAIADAPNLRELASTRFLLDGIYAQILDALPRREEFRHFGEPKWLNIRRVLRLHLAASRPYSYPEELALEDQTALPVLRRFRIKQTEDARLVSAQIAGIPGFRFLTRHSPALWPTISVTLRDTGAPRSLCVRTLEGEVARVGPIQAAPLFARFRIPLQVADAAEEHQIMAVTEQGTDILVATVEIF
jgi:hypothetical protein